MRATRSVPCANSVRNGNQSARLGQQSHPLCQHPGAHDIRDGGRKHDVHRAKSSGVDEARPADECKSGHGNRDRRDGECDQPDSLSRHKEIVGRSRSPRCPDADADDHGKVQQPNRDDGRLGRVRKRDLQQRRNWPRLSHLQRAFRSRISERAEKSRICGRSCERARRLPPTASASRKSSHTRQAAR